MADNLDAFVAFCAEAFRAENEVVDRLTAKAEKYVGAAGVVLGFHIVEMQSLSFRHFSAYSFFSAVVIFGVALLILALSLALYSMRVLTSSTFPDTGDMNVLQRSSGDDQTRPAIASVYLRLRDDIRAINEKRASGVKNAGIALSIGLLLSLVGQFILKLLLKVQ